MRKIKINTDIKVFHFDTIDSTNNECKRLAKSGIDTALVISEHQTNGRGRLSRSFYSPKGSGLYMSLLLRPTINAEEITSVTTTAAVAVSNAIDKISGKKSLIKWVNDIYLDGKKVCGILCEAGFEKQNAIPDYIVLGIGINLYTKEKDFPDELKDKAGSLFDEEIDIKEKLINEILKEFFPLYACLPKKDYMQLYRKKSMLKEKTVSFIKDDTLHFGTVVDINDNAEIVIKTKDEIITLFAGEVSLQI